ncbi:MAG: S-layer homology domain-containing protein [Clostridia bacterium]|nr:S-layer homology domain-containing protein [Clostridia bacterium]
MRKTKRIVSLLITVAMMLTMVLPMTVSAAFSDVPASHHYYDAITNLSSEGILDGMGDGTFAPESPVTRAQFTKIICYALSVGNLTYSEEERSIFTDLAPEHWAANNIVTAYKQGIINGMGDGTFAPEAGVQYEQAVKMVVCALGYSQTRAEALGGYPGGYMSLANQAKILKGITDAKMYEVMNRGAVAQLIDNMLDAEQIQDGQPGGSIREEVSTNKSVDGQVIAGYGVALYTGDSELDACSKNEIIIQSGSNRVYFDVENINGFDIYEYIGRNVTIYYEDESGVNVNFAKSIALQPRKNETVKINLDSIYKYDSSKIEYFVDDKRIETDEISYSSSSYNLWNGQPDSRTIKELLDHDGNYQKSGYITLVSSQANQAVDVALLKTYDTVIVSSINATNNKVFIKKEGAFVDDTRYDSGIELNVRDRNKSVTITLNGSNYSLSSIRENNVLSIAKSENGKVIEVLVSTTGVSGTIESITTAGAKTIKLKSNNNNYQVLPNVCSPDSATLEAGVHVALSLDAFGKVARYVITAESTYYYGYISSLEEETGADARIEVMMYKPTNSDSSLKGTIYRFANRVKINGTNYNVVNDMSTILYKLNQEANDANTGFASEVEPTEGKYTYSQPVRYSLNSSNQINAILTGSWGGGSDPFGDPATSLNLIGKTGAGGVGCVVDATTLEQYNISATTPILYVPQNREEDLDKYTSKSRGVFDEGKSYYVQLANVSSTNIVGCVYLYGVVDSGSGSLNAAISEDNKPLIVKEISTVMYNEVSNVRRLTLIDVTLGMDEASLIYCYEDNVDLSGLAEGDVIRVAIGTDAYVEELQILATAADVVAGSFNFEGVYDKTDGSGSGRNADFRVLHGVVKSKDGNTFVVIPGYNVSADASTGETYTLTDGVPVYKVLTSAEAGFKISVSSSGEIYGNSSQHSKVMVYTVEGAIKAVVIFE